MYFKCGGVWTRWLDLFDWGDAKSFVDFWILYASNLLGPCFFVCIFLWTADRVHHPHVIRYILEISVILKKVSPHLLPHNYSFQVRTWRSCYSISTLYLFRAKHHVVPSFQASVHTLQALCILDYCFTPLCCTASCTRAPIAREHTYLVHTVSSIFQSFFFFFFFSWSLIRRRLVLPPAAVGFTCPTLFLDRSQSWWRGACDDTAIVASISPPWWLESLPPVRARGVHILVPCLPLLTVYVVNGKKGCQRRGIYQYSTWKHLFSIHPISLIACYHTLKTPSVNSTCIYIYTVPICLFFSWKLYSSQRGRSCVDKKNDCGGRIVMVFLLPLVGSIEHGLQFHGVASSLQIDR